MTDIWLSLIMTDKTHVDVNMSYVKMITRGKGGGSDLHMRNGETVRVVESPLDIRMWYCGGIENQAELVGQFF